MAKPRKRHVQQALPFRTRGGARVGAGRPAKSARSSEPHKRRPTFKRTLPLHVTIRVAADLGTLRRRDAYVAIREATITTLKRDDFHIVHMSIQGTHVHLIVEAHGKDSLARGMQGFQISAAKHLNRAVSQRRGERRRGCVFTDRYHARTLNSPRSVRACIRYVLNNWRHHGEDRRGGLLDPYSSAVSFLGGWRELAHRTVVPLPPAHSLAVWLPKTWLLARGWQRQGPIGAYEVPG